MDTVTVPLDTLNLVLAGLLPILTAVVTARFANSALKSITLIFLTVLTAALQEIFEDGGVFDTQEFLYTAVLQFLMSVGFHFGLLKPVSVTGDNGVVAKKIPAGVGQPNPAPVGPVDD